MTGTDPLFDPPVMDALSTRESAAMTVDRITAPCAAAAQLLIERRLFDALAHSSHRLRLWQPLPALIATLAEASRPGFARASARAGERGLPVHVRCSGGGAVCVGPGSLVVSHLYRSPHNDIDASYRQFAGLLRQAIAALAVSVTQEQVAGAYCDGRFDLAWQGRKVGGIAQRRRVQNGSAHVWVSAVLAVEARALRYPEAVRDFHADLGSPRVPDPGRATTLAHCLPDHDAQDLLRRVGDAIVRAFESRAQTGALL